MAIYYVLVSDGYIQQDTRTGQLEVYDEREDAKKAARNGAAIVEVEIKRSES